jgi:hypothetical protein
VTASTKGGNPQLALFTKGGCEHNHPALSRWEQVKEDIMKDDIRKRYGVDIWFYRIEQHQKQARKNLGQERKIKVNYCV